MIASRRRADDLTATDSFESRLFSVCVRATAGAATQAGDFLIQRGQLNRMPLHCQAGFDLIAIAPLMSRDGYETLVMVRSTIGS